MDTISRAHTGRMLLRLAPILLAVVAMAVVYVMMSNQDSYRRGTHTASRSAPAAQPNTGASRASDVYYQNQANYDQAYSACQELGIGILARSLRVKATPAAVAKAYSRDELPAFRTAMSDGCLAALQGKPPVHRSPEDADLASP